MSYKCDACGKVSAYGNRKRDAVQTVRVPAVRCPECGSTNHTANGSRIPEGANLRRQNRKCRDCGAPFVVVIEEPIIDKAS